MPPSLVKRHYLEVHEALRNFSVRVRRHSYKGYSGPWIENVWISHFKPLADGADDLSRHFGPFVPLFVPWLDMLLMTEPGKRWYTYSAKFQATLARVIRRDIIYITVSQYDGGLNKIPLQDIRTVLVLSAGGYGHVPVPLLGKSQIPIDSPPMAARNYSLSFVGNFHANPRNTTRSMREILSERVQYAATATSKEIFTGWAGDKWREVVVASRMSLCPRGYGRTSFHLAEVVQLGHIPVHVFEDQPWIPYRRAFERIGFSIRLNETPTALEKLFGASNAELETREAAARQLRTLWTLDGTMAEIARFMRGDSDRLLACQRLPTVGLVSKPRWGHSLGHAY